MNALPSHAHIIEVGPRDGLQNEPQPIPLEQKLALIHGLVNAGLTKIEAGSFVNPQWVPQMADSETIFQHLQQLPTPSHVTFTALTPNAKGMQRAIAAGLKEVAVFAAASESFSQKNTNCSIAESLERFRPVLALAKEHHMAVRGYISCAFACPYEGAVDVGQVTQLTEALLAMGCYEVSLGDTIGVATPRQITTLLEHLTQRVAPDQLALHLHDTYGQAIANCYAGLQAGITRFDASVAGLGGCPFAPGASGNLATEDLVYLLNGLGIEHGVDLAQLIATGAAICAQLNRPYTVKAGAATLAKAR